jgi:hypothetical protein
MKILIVLILLNAILGSESRSGNERILLKDVEVLTLHRGLYTTFRRVSSVPQLNCIGGTARSESDKVHTVQCKNMGFNGKDYDWKCESQLDSNLELGEAIVTCEGYGYPDDPYILVGSCGLEYTLEYKNRNNNYHHKPTENIKHTHTTTIVNNSHNGLLYVFMCCVFLFITYLVCLNCCQEQYVPRMNQIYEKQSGGVQRTGVPEGRETPVAEPSFVRPVAEPSFVRPVTEPSFVPVIQPPVTQTPNVVIIEKERSDRSAFVDGVAMGSILSRRAPAMQAPHTHTHTHTETYIPQYTPPSTSYTSYSYDSSPGNSGSGSQSENTYTSTTFAETKRR